eukprot:scaffold145675_cov48-Attheya_sp.AAC.2
MRFASPVFFLLPCVSLYKEASYCACLFGKQAFALFNAVLVIDGIRNVTPTTGPDASYYSTAPPMNYHLRILLCSTCVVGIACKGYMLHAYELPRRPNNTTVSGTHTQTNATQSRTPWVLVRCCPCDITAPHRTMPFSYGDNTQERKATAALDWYRCTI